MKEVIRPEGAPQRPSGCHTWMPSASEVMALSMSSIVQKASAVEKPTAGVSEIDIVRILRHSMEEEHVKTAKSTTRMSVSARLSP